MNKQEFINNIDKDIRIFNEINLWGIVYDYIDKCFKCYKIFDGKEKRKYLFGNKRICYNCLLSNNN